jgi:hypothetical protein
MKFLSGENRERYSIVMVVITTGQIEQWNEFKYELREFLAGSSMQEGCRN